MGSYFLEVSLPKWQNILLAAAINQKEHSFNLSK
ncbi:Uncharacterised protein [Citrobacter amalonaticus]|uniref:Uncharacterized protein n=1 Tax=Citrobacter amalonaticus TaxID=35703 RepID=A0A6N2WRE4_CITAM